MFFESQIRRPNIFTTSVIYLNYRKVDVRREDFKRGGGGEIELVVQTKQTEGKNNHPSLRNQHRAINRRKKIRI